MEITLLTPLNYAESPTASMFVICSVVNQNGNTVQSPTSTIIATVIDKPKAPLPSTLTVLNDNGVPESITSPGVVGTVTAVNPDPTASNITFSIVSDNHLSYHLGTTVCTSINGVMTCSVQVTLVGNITDAEFNATGYGTSTIIVRATDSASGKFYDTVIHVPVQFVNQPPLAPVWVGSNAVQSGSPINTTVGILQASDVHAGIPQTLSVMGSSDFAFRELSSARRSTDPTRWVVVVNNPSLNTPMPETITVTVNITNWPPVGQPMWVVMPISIVLNPLPMSTSVITPDTIPHASGSAFDINEKTAAGSTVGTLVVNNFVRTDITYTQSLTVDGSGFFALQHTGATWTLVRSTNFLQYSPATEVLTVTVTTTFSKKGAVGTLTVQVWTPTGTLQVKGTVSGDISMSTCT